MDYNTRSSLIIECDENRVGQIIKIFGRDGELVVKLWDSFPDEYNIEEPLWIEIDSKGVPLYIKSFKSQGNTRAVIVFEDWENESLALELEGKYIYYEFQDGDSDNESSSLIGWTLKDLTTSRSGKIVDVSLDEYNPIIFVVFDGIEKMIPFNEDFVESINESENEIFMNLPDGILDL